MKIDFNTFETMGGTTRNDLRFKRYKFSKITENLPKPTFITKMNKIRCTNKTQDAQSQSDAQTRPKIHNLRTKMYNFTGYAINPL